MNAIHVDVCVICFALRLTSNANCGYVLVPDTYNSIEEAVMAKRTRKRYTTEQKRTILAAALKERLTALQVQKKFGVTPVTYYSWRKKSGATRRRGRPAGIGRAAGLVLSLRSEVQNRVRSLLPEIVRGEVNSYLDSVLGAEGRRRGRPRKF